MIQAVLIEGKPNEKRKNCFDCYYCQASVSWWCTNDGAIEARKTSIPGINKCPFWKPVKIWEELTTLQRLFGEFIKLKAGEDDGTD